MAEPLHGVERCDRLGRPCDKKVAGVAHAQTVQGRSARWRAASMASTASRQTVFNAMA
jgi:hypothetical protein